MSFRTRLTQPNYLKDHKLKFAGLSGERPNYRPPLSPTSCKKTNLADAFFPSRPQLATTAGQNTLLQHGLPTSPVVRFALALPDSYVRRSLFKLIHSSPSINAVQVISGPPLRDLNPHPGLSRDTDTIYWNGDPFLQLLKQKPLIEMTRDEDTLTETLSITYDPFNRASFHISYPHSLITGSYVVRGKIVSHKGDLIGLKGLIQAMNLFYSAIHETANENRTSHPRMPGSLRTQIKALHEFTGRRVNIGSESPHGLTIKPETGILASIQMHSGFVSIKNTHETYLIVLKSPDGLNIELIFPGQEGLLVDGASVHLGIDRAGRRTMAKPFIFEDPVPVFHPLEIFDLMNWDYDLSDWNPLSMDEGPALKERIQRLFFSARKAGQEMGYASHVTPIIPIAVPYDSRTTDGSFMRWYANYLHPLLIDEWLRHDTHVGAYKIIFVSSLNEEAYWWLIKNKDLRIS